MCGRFGLTSEISELQKRLDFLEMVPDHEPKYNIAPLNRCSPSRTARPEGLPTYAGDLSFPRPKTQMRSNDASSSNGSGPFA